MAASKFDRGNGFRAFMEQEFFSSTILFYTVRAYVDLGIADILARAGEPLTVKEIAAQLPSETSNAEFLGRLMTFGAGYGYFQDVTPEAAEETVIEEGDRRFGLTEMSAVLVEKEAEDENKSMARFIRFITSDKSKLPYTKLADAVLTGKDPFFLAFQKSSWELGAGDPKWAKVVNQGMAAHSSNIMGELVKEYGKFAEVKRLVDVGGGIGASLMAITRAHPDIQGVNFDLPHVVASAPPIPNVEHVGGDMFQSVPEGDAIFMKWILHDWTDQECVQILKNCHKSLPENGKVILVENVLPDPKQPTPQNYRWDVSMLAVTSGRERTAPRWRRVLKGADFPRMEIIPGPLPDLFIIEAYKT